MKKRLLATAILVLAVGATACSKKADTPSAASVADTEAVESTAEEETTEEEEEIEEDYMSGLITAINGDILTVKNDEDETEKDYDISAAEISQEFPFAEGDWIEIAYPAETTEDPVPAITVEVLDSVIAQNTDPSAEGTVVDATMNNITIQVDGEDYTLSTSNAYIVGENGIQTGKLATVTYIGDLDDEPMAVKVVMEDSYNTPDAEKFAFIGEVCQIGEDGDNVVLESGDGDFYTFVSDDIDFSDYAEGDILEIEYTGTVTAKEVAAVAITKR